MTKPTKIKITMTRVRVNSHGYDQHGAYWGVGSPLYSAHSDDGELNDMIRASSRTAAKMYLRLRHKPLELAFYN